MSNTSATPANDPTVVVPVSKFKSTLNRGVNFVKTHKKATIAVAVLVSLVGANAILEKTEATPTPDDNIEIRPTVSGFEVVDTSTN